MTTERITAAMTANGDEHDLTRRAIGLLRDDARVLLGITGSPGAGKTTIAQQLVDSINSAVGSDENSPVAAYLPMDGYHLANSTLNRLGMSDRKGAIDTFDGWGFVALLRRLLSETDHTVYAPSFDRNVDEGIAGEIAIPASARIVVAEGNYLLIDQAPWSDIRALVAEIWFCETPDDERLRRLVDRHERHGRSPEAAKAWATTVDGSNASLVQPSQEHADLIVSGLSAQRPRSSPGRR